MMLDAGSTLKGCTLLPSMFSSPAQCPLQAVAQLVPQGVVQLLRLQDPLQQTMVAMQTVTALVGRQVGARMQLVIRRISPVTVTVYSTMSSTAVTDSRASHCLRTYTYDGMLQVLLGRLSQRHRLNASTLAVVSHCL